MALANKQLLGPKRERMPTPEEEAKKREPDEPRGGYVNPKKRKENAEALESLPTTIIPHAVAAEDRRCSSCGEEIRPIGTGDRSVEYEWVPGRIERRVHVVEVGRCPCKQHYARGPAPRRVQEGCTFGPGLLTKLACTDTMSSGRRLLSSDGYADSHAPQESRKRRRAPSTRRSTATAA